MATPGTDESYFCAVSGPVRTVIDVLRREKLYLNADKQKYLCREMKILGRIVDDDGIRMDPDKVDSILNWKVPTSKELLRGFLGSVGYLADDVATVRIPMGILTSLTGSDSSFGGSIIASHWITLLVRLLSGW